MPVRGHVELAKIPRNFEFDFFWFIPLIVYARINKVFTFSISDSFKVNLFQIY